ncbi:MAG TPA: hypothetical protein VGA70_07635 [Longimicrobiales bacterium]|jgi:hypothetical protein
MNDERLAFVSEEEAARLWKRAAELQVEASRRIEERSRSLHAPPGPSGFPAGHHFPIGEVLAAAREVGIDEEFLTTAVAELLEDRAEGQGLPPDFIERCAARFFGSPPSTLEATGRIRAPVAEVYRILQLLLPGEPYRLRLRGTLGEDPLTDGVLVFDAPDSISTPDSYSRRVLLAEDRIPRLSVTLRAARSEEGEECWITVRGRVDTDPEPAFWWGSLLTGASSVVGSAAGLGGGLLLGLAGGMLAWPALGVGVLAGAAGYFECRGRYLRPLERSTWGLNELLEVLDAAVKTGGAFLQADRGEGVERAPRQQGRDRALPPG